MGPGLTGLRQALGLLTRIPFGDATNVDRAAAWFPLAGSLIGLTVGGVYAAAFAWTPSLLAAILAIAVGVSVTGALHEDGLGDAFDAFGSGARGEEALRIMRDPRLGAYGVTAVVFSIIWRLVALGSLTPTTAIAGLVGAHTLGRLAAVVVMATTQPARPDGMGRSGAAGITMASVTFALVSGLAMSALALGPVAGLAILVAVLTVYLIHRAAIRRVGGYTGDILGAAEQFTEILVLTIVAAAAWQGWAPWWAS